MKTIYLVRHAKSGTEDYIKNDIERHLSERGYKDAEKQAEQFRQEFKKPGCIISSPAVRAYTTALIFAKHLLYNPKDIQINASIYDAGLSQLFYVINELSDEYESAMVVGHNPGLTYLINEICGNVISELPTTGVAAIELNVDKWNEVNTGSGVLMKELNSKV